ncbi:hypothetical protein O6P43_005991 [Quillaja saponaria]|uniref:Uncharacterized protein n=1 Tax=Quillaja saponaria TaxID=32244 RepID=A0AAD7Q7C2_QUISA|nr:hypothetical protein O6P43_005991 [Quillaja saponaria]
MEDVNPQWVKAPAVEDATEKPYGDWMLVKKRRYSNKVEGKIGISKDRQELKGNNWSMNNRVSASSSKIKEGGMPVNDERVIGGSQLDILNEQIPEELTANRHEYGDMQTNQMGFTKFKAKKWGAISKEYILIKKDNYYL